MNLQTIKTEDKIDFKNKNEPYLVKNYAKNWKAYKDWSFEYLKNLNSDLSVNTILGNYSEKMEIVPLKFKDYIEKVISQETKSYLAVFHLFKAFPQLKEHINYENVKKNSVHCNILSWIGPKGAITGFHADWSENINISIKGKKNFYLVSPKYNEFMYPSKKFERATILSNVNLKDVDENKFPLFKKAKITKVILEEGDALYIPRGWWHYAESLTPTINVSFHYWNLFNFFRDMVIEISKMLLHNIGLYKKYNCTCHSYNEKGERFVRSKFMPQNILKIKRD